jgi:DNA/RNA endonuclease G (NUC1)
MQGLASDWRSYAVPVKDVEELTNLKFFTALPEAVAAELRSRKPERKVAEGR